MKIYKNLSGLEFKVIKKVSKDKSLVQFLETGSIVETWTRNMSAGKVADPYQKTRLNIGYLGFYDKTKKYHKQALQLWSNMMKRCYSENDPKGYFRKGVTVCPSWHCYANFLADIERLPNFNNWLNKENYQLDKDLLGDGTVYSKYTCMFLEEHVNKSLGKLNKTLVDGEWVTTIL